jgi:SAM-dependent methyltransferase/methyltransferase-like protein
MPAATPASDFAYDRVPYPGSADAETHPRHLEAIALLSGMQPADLTSCRVLEIGCASGRNLLPMACEFPDSRFIGIDLAAEQINEATSIARELKLDNVEFRHASLTDIDQSWDEFDYILCLGVFSWVLPETQERILATLNSNLALQGVGVISYKTYPGWYQLDVLRDALRIAAATTEVPSQKIKNAREYLAFLANAVPEDAPNGRLYHNEHAYLSEAADHYLFHDYLAENSYPLYFHEFHRRVVEHELQYLGELNFTYNALPTDNAQSREFLTSQPFVERCQALDFINNRSYRKSIICRGDVQLNPELEAGHVQALKVSLSEIPKPTNFSIGTTEPLSFNYASGRFAVAAPFGKAALRYLVDVYPRSVSIRELCQGANRLLPEEVRHMGAAGSRGEELLATAMLGALQAGLVQVCRHAPELANTISEQPLASPLVRAMAAGSRVVVNHCHQNIKLSADAATLLTQLDGTRSIEELAQVWPGDDAKAKREILNRVLTELCDNAFLIG